MQSFSEFLNETKQDKRMKKLTRSYKSKWTSRLDNGNIIFYSRVSTVDGKIEYTAKFDGGEEIPIEFDQPYDELIFTADRNVHGTKPSGHNFSAVFRIPKSDQSKILKHLNNF